MGKIIFFYICLSTIALAQQLDIKNHILDIDMNEYCKNLEDKSNDDISENGKKTFCENVNTLQYETVAPIVFNKKDPEGNLWKIRFNFGFTRTDYYKTDLHIKSDIINIVVKDVEMIERTSDSHFNPKNWHHINEAFQWIDEPTNTFTLSLEKNKNIFYFSVFHPKYLKSVAYSKTMVNGEPVYSVIPMKDTDDFSAPIPENHVQLYLGNTHHNMIYQIGYGRQFTFFDTKRAGKLSYTIKGDIGINFGKARSVRIDPGVAWEDYIDKDRVQGYNLSLGHRLEYQRGIVSIFVDQKALYSKIEHGFYDGTVNYNLLMVPTSFGIGIDLFSKKKKR
jgi:hypothetical protein